MTSRHTRWIAALSCVAAAACSSGNKTQTPPSTGTQTGGGASGSKPSTTAGVTSGGGTTGAVTGGSQARGTAGTTTGSGGHTSSSGGSGPTAMAGSPGTSTGGTAGSTPPPAGDGSASVLQFHKNANRDGHYIEATFTRAAAAKIHKDTGFMATMTGPTYAQPLYFEGGPGGKDVVIVATESNEVTAFDAMTGAMVWRTMVAASGPGGGGPSGCSLGNITPLGVTGTPVIDAASRTLFLDAMSTSGKHSIYALGIDDGKVKTGWPVDVSTLKAGSLAFNSPAENQRGALLILNGILYVPYGGHYGDCGDYHGWVVGVPIDNPKAPLAWATRASAGGVWAPSGVASDGKSVFVATGNTMASAPGNSFPAFSSPATWGDGEAIIRLPADLNFMQDNKDFFAAENWAALDGADSDVGGSGVVLVDVPGATPSKVAFAAGKDGSAYIASVDNLGGMGGQLGTPMKVSGGAIMQSSVAYTTPTGTFVVIRAPGTVCNGGSGALTSLKLSAASPPVLSGGWCAGANSTGSPIVTTIDGTTESIVWYVAGTKLLGFNGETGDPVFNGGAAGDAVTSADKWQTPIVAKGRLYFASSNQLHAFTL